MAKTITKPATEAKPKEPYTFKKFWHSWLWPLIWAVLVVKLVINPFLLEAYEVPTESMVGTILPGDRLMAEKFTYKSFARDRINPPASGAI